MCGLAVWVKEMAANLTRFREFSVNPSGSRPEPAWHGGSEKTGTTCVAIVNPL